MSDTINDDHACELADRDAAIQTLTGERDAALAEVGLLRDSNAILSQERDAARNEASALRTSNASLQAQVDDLPKQIARTIARFGIRSSAVNQPQEKNDKPSLTETCLAAKGTI